MSESEYRISTETLLAKCPYGEWFTVPEIVDALILNDWERRMVKSRLLRRLNKEIKWGGPVCKDVVTKNDVRWYR